MIETEQSSYTLDTEYTHTVNTLLTFLTMQLSMALDFGDSPSATLQKSGAKAKEGRLQQLETQTLKHSTPDGEVFSREDIIALRDRIAASDFTTIDGLASYVASEIKFLEKKGVTKAAVQHMFVPLKEFSKLIVEAKTAENNK